MQRLAHEAGRVRARCSWSGLRVGVAAVAGRAVARTARAPRGAGEKDAMGRDAMAAAATVRATPQRAATVPATSARAATAPTTPPWRSRRRRAVRGLAVADGGVRLALGSTSLPRGPATTLRFAIDDADGPVRDFEVTHEKRMHLIVVRRDGHRLPASAPDARCRRHVERADHACRRGRLSRLRGLPARRRAAHAGRGPHGRRRGDLRAVPAAERRSRGPTATRSS